MENLPTLSQLEPVANWLAMRFAQREVSTRKIKKILSILHYHCLRQREERMDIEFGLLGAWLTKERKGFKDCEAVKVLCAVLKQYADQFDTLKDEVEKRELYRSLTDFLTLLNWKFRTFSGKEGKEMRKALEQYANDVQGTAAKVADLKEMKTGQDLAALCRDIKNTLFNATEDLPFAARLAVGVRKGREK